MRALISILAWLSLSVAAEVIVVDDNGQKLHLTEPAKRIISLAPNITEVLFYIGAGDQIVGADEYSNYPEAAKDILRVNNYAAANYELILSLKPDLVIAWQSGNGDKIINPLDNSVQFPNLTRSFRRYLSRRTRGGSRTVSRQRSGRPDGQARLSASPIPTIKGQTLAECTGTHVVPVQRFCSRDNQF